MIFDISKQEMKKAQAIEASYQKLIAEVEAKIEELKPDEDFPDDPKDFDK